MGRSMMTAGAASAMRVGDSYPVPHLHPCLILAAFEGQGSTPTERLRIKPPFVRTAVIDLSQPAPFDYERFEDATGAGDLHPAHEIATLAAGYVRFAFFRRRERREPAFSPYRKI
jgi:hypothetical protein